MIGGETTIYDLYERIAELKQERDAMVVHVVQIVGALELTRDSIALLAEIDDENAVLNMWLKEMDKVLTEQPSITLVRRDLIMQTEALEEVAAVLKNNGHDDAAQTARIKARIKHQQANQLETN